MGCLTVGGRKVNARCVFPFSFRGRTYNGCTTISLKKLWCSTRTDSNGKHIRGQWGYCNSACQTDQDCIPYSIEACKKAAAINNLEIGSDRFPFLREDYAEEGCYSYKTGHGKGHVFLRDRRNRCPNEEGGHWTTI